MNKKVVALESSKERNQDRVEIKDTTIDIKGEKHIRGVFARRNFGERELVVEGYLLEILPTNTVHTIQIGPNDHGKSSESLRFDCLVA